jgi:hypothetical protein
VGASEGPGGVTGGRSRVAFNNVRRELERTALAASLAENLATAAEALLNSHPEDAALTPLRDALTTYRKAITGDALGKKGLDDASRLAAHAHGAGRGA